MAPVAPLHHPYQPFSTSLLSSLQSDKKEPPFPSRPTSTSIYLSTRLLISLILAHFGLLLLPFHWLIEVIRVILVFKPTVTFVTLHFFLTTTILQ